MEWEWKNERKDSVKLISVREWGIFWQELRKNRETKHFFGVVDSFILYISHHFITMDQMVVGIPNVLLLHYYYCCGIPNEQTNKRIIIALLLIIIVVVVDNYI